MGERWGFEIGYCTAPVDHNGLTVTPTAVKKMHGTFGLELRLD